MPGQTNRSPSVESTKICGGTPGPSEQKNTAEGQLDASSDLQIYKPETARDVVLEQSRRIAPEPSRWRGTLGGEPAQPNQDYIELQDIHNPEENLGEPNLALEDEDVLPLEEHPPPPQERDLNASPRHHQRQWECIRNHCTHYFNRICDTLGPAGCLIGIVIVAVGVGVALYYLFGDETNQSRNMRSGKMSNLINASEKM